MSRGAYVRLPRASGVTDAAAECDECGWSNVNRKNAVATGSIHARATGHQVNVRQEIGITYNPKGIQHKYEDV